jgi:hypothetical protein
MIHDLLSVTRRAPSGLGITATASSPAKPASPSNTPASQNRPATSASTAFVASANSGSQVALPSALAAYQEFGA